MISDTVQIIFLCVYDQIVKGFLFELTVEFSLREQQPPRELLQNQP